jgi:hypothetical protein
MADPLFVREPYGYGLANMDVGAEQAATLIPGDGRGGFGLAGFAL